MADRQSLLHMIINYDNSLDLVMEAHQIWLAVRSEENERVLCSFRLQYRERQRRILIRWERRGPGPFQ